MSADLFFIVIPVDANGEVVLQVVHGGPHYGFADSYFWELAGEVDVNADARHFVDVVAGLALDWYRRPTMRACLAERRNPTARDCFRPGEIRNDVVVILDRLASLESRLPRRYRFRIASDGEWGKPERIFVDGRELTVSAGWNRCTASWSKERPLPEFLENFRQGIVFGPDIQYDLRGVQEVRCFDSAYDGQRHVPGKPISLLVASQTPLEYFDWLLRPILDFCDQAEAGGFLVFTSRGP